jgi:DNA-binding transcriptional LysR family regulator
MSKTLSDTRIGQRLRFRDLQVFFAVAECGGMAKAAAQLDVTQPAVSEIIAGIESAFAVRLFDRTHRGRAHDLRCALLKRGLAAFDELKQGMRDIEFLADPTVGEVRIGCPNPSPAHCCHRWFDSFASNIHGSPCASIRCRPRRWSCPICMRVSWIWWCRGYRYLMHGTAFGEDLNVEVLFDDPPVVATRANSRWARRRRSIFPNWSMNLGLPRPGDLDYDRDGASLPGAQPAYSKN